MTDHQPFQEYDMDIYGITQKIFSSPIKPPFSYQIAFDPDERISGSPVSLYIFEQLLIIFTEGLKIYYRSPSIAIEKISPKEFHDIQQYFKSLGFILNCQVVPIIDENSINAILDNLDDEDDLPSLTSPPKAILYSASGNSKIESTGDNIKDYTYTLVKENTRYIISFDYLPLSDPCKI